MNAPDKPSELIERLRRGESAAFSYLYEKYYPAAAAFIRVNSGQDQDARDVFQEALLVLFKKTRSNDFRLKADPGAYLYAVVRNLWLYRLRTDRSNPEILTNEFSSLPDPASDALELLFEEKQLDERHTAVKQLIEALKPGCQKLIEYAFYFRFSTAEMAALLGYAESFIKVKKHRCLEALRKKVTRHPLFNHEP